MPVKIRLQRHGKKGKPYFKIVVADSRVKRDGRLIERIGSYNPNTDPATIELDFDKSAEWLRKGAQPTDTARAILSYKGVLMYNHLMKGVDKGALTEEQAKAKFEKWLEEKNAKIQAKSDSIQKAKDKEAAERFAAEQEVNKKKAAELAAKIAPPAEESDEAEEVEAEAPAEEAKAEEPAEEAKAESPAEEADAAKEESPKAEEKEDAPKAEAKEEEKAEEEKKAE